MALKKYKPTTAGQRQLVQIDRSHLWKGRPEKSLTEGKTRTGGRNNLGRITSWHRGGGHKRRLRLVDFHRTKKDMFATVQRFEYDPNRTAFIALIQYEDGEQSYILAPQRMQIGDKIQSGKNADIKPGNTLPIGSIPVGTLVHNVELKIGGGGKIARSAGAYCQIAGRDSGMVIVRLSSGEQRFIHANCLATVGAVSNADHQNTVVGKAGRSRWLGRRPVVRGVAMNPVDHPHGGGEGRTSGGRHPVTPWGKSTKGKKTRHNKRTSKFIIRSRHLRKNSRRG